MSDNGLAANWREPDEAAIIRDAALDRVQLAKCRAALKEMLRVYLYLPEGDHAKPARIAAVRQAQEALGET